MNKKYYYRRPRQSYAHPILISRNAHLILIKTSGGSQYYTVLCSTNRHPSSELRRLRERAGLTQAALAAKLGVVPNSVARWERNERASAEGMTRPIRMPSE